MIKYRFLFYNFLWLLLSCLVTAKDVDFLMIGNSFTNANHLEEMIQAMLEEALPFGSRVFSMRYRKPESRLVDDVQDNALEATISERSWTWVTMQEQSQIPTFWDVFDEAFNTSIRSAATINQWIAQAQAETILLMTWGRRTFDKRNPHLLPDFITMQDRLHEGYQRMQKALSTPVRPVRIAPAGLAFQTIHNSIAGNATADGTAFSTLYEEDGVHPSIEGSYLVACVVYATLTGNDPRNLRRYTGPDEIPADRRLALRQAAAETVANFNEDNEINRQFFERQNQLSPSTANDHKDSQSKPYIASDQKDKGQPQGYVWYIVSIVMASMLVVLLAKKQRAAAQWPWQTTSFAMSHGAVTSPADMELVEMKHNHGILIPSFE